jgi:hypothetical protein
VWIVRLALDRPYTFVVLAVLILLLGTVAVVTTPVDIFPKIDIPVVSIIWTYAGLSTSEMERRVTTFSEFVLATVNDIRSIESQPSTALPPSRFTSNLRCASTQPPRRSILQLTAYAFACRPASIHRGFSALALTPFPSFSSH